MVPIKRKYMRYAKVLLLAILISGCIGQQPETGEKEEAPSQEVIATDQDMEVTPIKDFFVVDLGDKPEIDIEKWRLEVTGLVDNPLVLTYDDILSIPSVVQVTTLYCVTGFEGTGEWTGVPLQYILEKAGYSEDTVSVIFYAADDYTSSISLEKALQDDTILAYKVNGVTLPKEHGYPLRLVVPDKWGYKWVKWIVRIELVDYDYEGYWESRGFSNIADVPEDIKNREAITPE
jgi:DMSO/TMAO reductase YedYZ molybdopterin-dependent catalytic subunit